VCSQVLEKQRSWILVQGQMTEKKQSDFSSEARTEVVTVRFQVSSGHSQLQRNPRDDDITSKKCNHDRWSSECNTKQTQEQLVLLSTRRVALLINNQTKRLVVRGLLWGKQRWKMRRMIIHGSKNLIDGCQLIRGKRVVMRRNLIKKVEIKVLGRELFRNKKRVYSDRRQSVWKIIFPQIELSEPRMTGE
jgi:hypothetical protein